ENVHGPSYPPPAHGKSPCFLVAEVPRAASPPLRRSDPGDRPVAARREPAIHPAERAGAEEAPVRGQRRGMRRLDPEMVRPAQVARGDPLRRTAPEEEGAGRPV